MSATYLKRPLDLLRSTGVWLLCLWTLGLCSHGQVTTGTISGFVKDTSGGVIPGAAVSATHMDTGTKRSTVTDGTGHFVLAQLTLGEYEVQAEASGFRTALTKGIVLTVGREVTTDFVLQVGAVTEQVVVSGQAPLIETTNSSLSGLVDEKQVRELPLNGRSFDQLITLTPGAVQFTNKNRNAAVGFTIGFGVGGARWESSKFMLDGIEYVGSGSIATTPSTASGKLLGVEAIREFAVITSNADASYGKKFGGQINIITRSGTNEFHGTVYEFLRNNHLDARNFFDREEAPQFKQNNFGGAAGGPIRKNKDWFFANYEGFRSRLGLSNVAIVPELDARRGILPLPDPNNPSQRVPTFVGLVPGVVPALAFFPEPNGPNLGDGRAFAFSSPTETVNENFFLVRLDHNFSDQHSLFGRYIIDDSDITSPRENPHFAIVIPFRNQQAAINLKDVFSPTIVNTARIGFSRAVNITDVTSDLPIPPSLIFVPGLTGMGNVSVPGLTSLGGYQLSALLAGRYNNRNAFTYSDQLNLSRGSHLLQLGGQVERLQSNEDQGTSRRADFRFNGLLEFLQGRANSFTGPLPGSSGIKGWRQTYFSLFFQDNFEIVPSFTLNLGLRYELMTNPTEVNGRVANFDVVDGQLTNPLRTEPFVSGNVFAENNSLKGFAPRAGFAWNIGGGGKTVVRGGAGIFYNQIEDDFRRFTGANPPFFRVVTASNVSFPTTTSTLGASGLTRPLGLSRYADVPTLLQYNLRIERVLSEGMRIAIGYAGSHGYHLSRSTDAQVAVPMRTAEGRLFNPPGTLRKNLQLGASSNLSVYDANSFFNALQLEFEQRMGGGPRLKVVYNFSKVRDDSSGTFFSLTTSQANDLFPTDHKFERGSSAFDVPHSLVANWTYDLPFHKLKGSSNRFVTGWQLNGILNLQSGQPFTVEVGFPRSRNGTTSAGDRPDLAPGASLNPILGPPQESRTYFDPTAFVLQDEGFFGNVARNTLRGPGIATVDLAVQKEIRLEERLGILIRIEAFNLLNRPNFAVPTPTARALFTPQGGRLSSAGILTETATSSRQLQFALKLLF